MSAWTIAALVAIALALTAGFASVPVWLSVAMIPIGLVVAVGAAFTLIGILGEVLFVSALLGIVIRCAVLVVRLRRHRRVGSLVEH
jgi:hypothetical protein